MPSQTCPSMAACPLYTVPWIWRGTSSSVACLSTTLESLWRSSSDPTTYRTLAPTQVPDVKMLCFFYFVQVNACLKGFPPVLMGTLIQCDICTICFGLLGKAYAQVSPIRQIQSCVFIHIFFLFPKCFSTVFLHKWVWVITNMYLVMCNKMLNLFIVSLSGDLFQLLLVFTSSAFLTDRLC